MVAANVSPLQPHPESKRLKRALGKCQSESADKKEILASCRASLRETKEMAFDESELPADFRQAFLRVVVSTEEAVTSLAASITGPIVCGPS